MNEDRSISVGVLGVAAALAGAQLARGSGTISLGCWDGTPHGAALFMEHASISGVSSRTRRSQEGPVGTYGFPYTCQNSAPDPDKAHLAARLGIIFDGLIPLGIATTKKHLYDFVYIMESTSEVVIGSSLGAQAVCGYLRPTRKPALVAGRGRFSGAAVTVGYPLQLSVTQLRTMRA